MSLDGYIADPNGGVDWMTGQDESAENGDSYENFIKTVDTVIMGWNTYHQITTELVYVRRHVCRHFCANACGNICENVHENGIRKFTADDMERVMEIWLNGNLEAHAFIPRKYWESNAEAVKEQLLEAEVFVCEKEGRIKGFAGLQGNYLAGIFVEAGSRSKGIGRELLNRVKETHPVFSLHVYAENERAVSFYRREGLEVVSREMEKDTGREEYTMEWRASAEG